MYTTEQIKALQQEIADNYPLIDEIRQQVGKQVFGQNDMVDRLLIGLLTNGHILLEGVPGLAKTLTIRTLAQVLQLAFSRIQFTPDLLPADVIGTMIYHQQKAEFYVRKGPVFTNLLLADEINRAPAKVQSALLEAMQERQVTIGENSYPLPAPFLVLATQNPLEQEGTYPLPEAQQDRFMLKVLVTYPQRQEERSILRSALQPNTAASLPEAVLDAARLANLRELCARVYLDEQVENYILDIVSATRNPAGYKLHSLSNHIAYGASPRATINLALAARALAMLRKRAYVVPDDVVSLAPDVLRHRIGLTYEAEAEDKDVNFVIKQILQTIPAP